jgi:NADH-quinone oxidoreductase subunit L
MNELLWLIPALPFLGGLTLILTGASLSRRAVPIIGAGSVGLSAVLTILIGAGFISSGQVPFEQVLWTWIDIGGFKPEFALRLDSLSMVFIFVITFVGFLIHLYSAEFMLEDEGYARFFTFLNLFVGSMLILVLANNLMLMYLGWEGVGLCSYLLIGFWYQEEKNGYAARKAFIITRVGDTAMAIGLFMLFKTFGTLNIQDILTRAPQLWNVGADTAVAIGFLLLGGAAGKSAQLPLQTWLPDAMAGPSPVSALIHAATMVTAGVYLIARMYTVFELAPLAQLWVGIIGALTLLISGCSALTQNDLKRILAYSTISQIGYMFLALGVGAWSSAIFHFMIHAFFKALLFLGAGAVIYLLHHEHNIFKMGGLRTKLPVIYWTFLAGAASLAAIPFITSGFYSKDPILWYSLASEKGNGWFLVAGMLGAFLTSIYTFRMVFVTFFGTEKTHIGHHAGGLMTIPLIILAILSIFAGFIELPHTLGHFQLFSDFLKPVLPVTSLKEGIESAEWGIQLSAAAISLAGVYIAYYLYIQSPGAVDRIKLSLVALREFWYKGWGFDDLYDIVLVRPFLWLSSTNKGDKIDKAYDGMVVSAGFFHRMFAWTQSGIMRWYMMGIVVGTILVLTLSLLISPE